MSAEDIKQTGKTTDTVVTADQGSIARAGEILRAGGLVAFPTETVYGLGADAGPAAILGTDFLRRRKRLMLVNGTVLV